MFNDLSFCCITCFSSFCSSSFSQQTTYVFSIFYLPPPLPLNHQGFRITTPAVSSFQLTTMLNKHCKGVSWLVTRMIIVIYKSGNFSSRTFHWSFSTYAIKNLHNQGKIFIHHLYFSSAIFSILWSSSTFLYYMKDCT